MTTTPILDWRSRHDPRSASYNVAPILKADKPLTDKEWAPGPVLHQLNEGACVGFAFASEAAAEPIPVDLARVKANVPRTWEGFARFLYGMARYLDPWEGEADEGTSVLAGAQAAQNVGVLREYRWAFNTDDVLRAIVQRGPVVVGTHWYSGMYSPVGGILRPSGNLVGGHAYLLTGYRTSVPELNGAPGVTVKNSWGTSWGVGGFATMGVADLNALLAQNGEACLPLSRSYGRS